MNIIIIRGYQKEAINHLNIRHYDNEVCYNNIILESLFYVEEEMDEMNFFYFFSLF